MWGCPMKKFSMLVALSVFCLGLVVGCDDSSSASDDNNETSAVESSSSVKDSDSTEESSSSIDKKSSGNETKDKSSSSDTKSSSSAKETKNSSDSKSSSSVKTDDSSSSNKDVSSSSVSSSSSENQSSSSSVKQSSSSVASSSSEYKPYNHQKVFSSDSLLSGAYKKFTDERNGRMYYYLTINGKNQDGESASVTVMAENLNIGEMVDGTKEQSNDSKIERYCYNDDTTNCDKYGGLYQWAEAMQLPSECNTKSCADKIKPNHQGICPKGWRLLTYDDFYIVVHADGNVNPLVEGVRAQGFGGHNYCGYSLIGAGYNWGYKFRAKDESAYWHYPEEGHSNDVNIASFVGLQTKSSTSNSTQDTYKTHGFSVRCVK